MSVNNTTFGQGELSPVSLSEKFKSKLKKFDFTVEETYNISLTDIEFTKIDNFGISITGAYHTGETGFPNSDTYSEAKRINHLLAHPTCVTGETEGSPVWFENAAWCNNCHTLLNADEKYVCAVNCPHCGSGFNEGVMRATMPNILIFTEHIPFDSPVYTEEDLLEQLRKIFT